MTAVGRGSFRVPGRCADHSNTAARGGRYCRGSVCRLATCARVWVIRRKIAGRRDIVKPIGPGWLHRLALISALLIAGGCATKAEKQLAAEQRAQQIPQLLIRAGDPDSLAAAAMLYRDPLWRQSESAAL